VVLQDHSGQASARFNEAFKDFEGKSDFTCVRLACTFLKDLYPENGVTQVVTPEQFLEAVVKWQSPETYSAEIYVTGSDNFSEALKAQKINQKKALRNAAVGLGAAAGLSILFLQTLSKVIF
jgi:hypothetical protein